MAKYEELKNKRVIITGGGSGIGQATAQRFADEGAKVFIFDINEEAMAETTKLIPVKIRLNENIDLSLILGTNAAIRIKLR